MSRQSNMARAMHEAYQNGGARSGNVERGADVVAKAFKEGDFTLDDLSIREMAIQTCGERWVDNLNPANARGRVILESGPAGGAVDTTGFTNLLSTVIGGLMDEEPQEVEAELIEGLVEFKKVTRQRGDRRVNLQKVGREANRVVREGESYSAFGFTEDWQDNPDTQKRGAYVLLTKEMIDEDETGKAIEAARTVINEQRMERVERIALSVSGVINSGLFLPQSISEAHYVASGAGLVNPARVNLTATGAELINGSDIEEALLRWNAMTDRVTGRPIAIRPADLTMLVMPGKWVTARTILGATEIESGTVTTEPYGVRKGPNPIAGLVGRVEQSTLINHLLTRAATDPFKAGGGVSAANATNYWYLGDFKRAFAYHEQHPMTVLTLGANTLLSFDKDVVFGVRVSEKGTMAVKDPRFVQQMRQA